MEDYTPRTYEGDDKLQVEMERLDLLRDSLTRSDQMTENMTSILTSFENRLMKLEDTITPVYMETGNLQRRHENIEKTLNAIDHVLGFYHVADEVEPTIREGPSAGIDNYLASMQRLQKAVNFFNKNNPGSQEMAQTTTLYESAKDSLEREFRNLLQQHSKPVPAVVILDTLAAEEESPNEETPPIEHLPTHVKTELGQMAGWLQTCGYSTDYSNVYGTIRSSILVRSLQGLRDQLKSGSKDSSNMSVTHSPGLALPKVSERWEQAKLKTQRDSSKKSLQKRMAFVRRASATLMKQSFAQHLEAAGLRRQPSNANDLMSEGVEVDIDFFITGVSALLHLIQSEAALMKGIIPEKLERKVFDMIIVSALDTMVKEGEQIGQNIKQARSRHDHTAVLGIFPVLKHLRAIKRDFDVALEGCQAPTRSKLAHLISTLDATGAKALDDFRDSIKNDPDKASNMPKDGTVHELTSNAIFFLEQLLEFTETAGSMLLSQDPNVITSKQSPDLEKKKKVAEYMTKVLSALGLNLSNKAETYSDTTMRSIFMLNNYNYILISLKRNGILELAQLHSRDVDGHLEDQILEQKRLYSQRSRILEMVRIVNPDAEHFYMQQITEQKKAYISSWSRVIHHIMEAHRPFSQQRTSPEFSHKLKDKDRQAIKEKFTGFNKEIEELYRVQKQYAIPNVELRDELRHDNKEFILPKYKMFVEKFKVVNFTKNPEKYIKYTVEDVSRFIDKFFDSASE